MAYGIRHKTTKRWLTVKGGESPLEARARKFTEDEATEYLASTDDFAGAWDIKPLASIQDGEGTVIQRAAAWNQVEQCQYALNVAAAAIDRTKGAAETLENVRSRWATAHSIPWSLVESAQLELNAGARTVPSLESLVKDLDAALREYQRIGNDVSAKRQPGVGGLT